MKTRNIIVSVLAVVLVALLCLAILVLPLRQLKQQQEADLGTVVPVSTESSASELSEVARAHPLAVSLYQHKQHTLITEDPGDYYEMIGSWVYSGFYNAFAPISRKSGLHYWDGSLPDGDGRRDGSWMGYERYAVDVYGGNEVGQFLCYSLDNATGQLVYLDYITPLDMVEFLPESDSDMVIMGGDIPTYVPDIASRVMDAYMETLDLPTSAFWEVTFDGNHSDNNIKYSPDSGNLFSRSMRYSPEYQILLTASIEIYDNAGLTLTLNASSLTPREVAVLLDMPLSDTEKATLPEAQPLSFHPYNVEKLTQLNMEYFSTDHGVYMMQCEPYADYALLTYFDRETATCRVLCDAPGCDHRSVDCPARSHAYYVCYPFVYGDGLYQLCTNYDAAAETRGFELVRRNLDGTQPEIVWREDSNDEVAIMDGYDSSAFLDEENLYLFWNRYQQYGLVVYMLRLNLDSGESQLYSQEGNYILFQNCTSDAFVAHIEDTHGNGHSLQLFDKELTPIGNDLSLKDKDGPAQYRVMDDRVYLLFQSSDPEDTVTEPVLSIYEAKNGSFTQFDTRVLPRYDHFTHLSKTADLVGLQDYDGTHRFTIIGQDCELYPNTLTGWQNGVEQFITPVTRCGEDYLVPLNRIPYSDFYISYAGVVDYSPSYTDQYAFISAEDYLASRPNYRIVQDVQ